MKLIIIYETDYFVTPRMRSVVVEFICSTVIWIPRSWHLSQSWLQRWVKIRCVHDHAYWENDKWASGHTAMT